MKKLILTLTIIFTITFTGCQQIYADTSDDFNEIPVYTQEQIDELKDKQEEALERKDKAHQLAENARYFGYDESSDFVTVAKEEWQKAHKDYQNISTQLESTRWSVPMKEYPAATVIWVELKEKGFNDAVIAGIMGNIMSEIGGQTLNLEYTNESFGYYGMCQWNKIIHREAKGQDLQGQIDYLVSSMEREFNIFGDCYKSNFDYNAFINLENEENAAIAFAACYERCGEKSYAVRAKNARLAYDYFTQF